MLEKVRKYEVVPSDLLPKGVFIYDCIVLVLSSSSPLLALKDKFPVDVVLKLAGASYSRMLISLRDRPSFTCWQHLFVSNLFQVKSRIATYHVLGESLPKLILLGTTGYPPVTRKLHQKGPGGFNDQSEPEMLSNGNAATLDTDRVAYKEDEEWRRIEAKVLSLKSPPVSKIPCYLCLWIARLSLFEGIIIVWAEDWAQAGSICFFFSWTSDIHF